MSKIRETIQSTGCSSYIYENIKNLYQFRDEIEYSISGDLIVVLVLEYLNLIEKNRNRNELLLTVKVNNPNGLSSIRIVDSCPAAWNYKDQIGFKLCRGLVYGLNITPIFLEFIEEKKFSIVFRNKQLKIDKIFENLDSKIFNSVPWLVDVDSFIKLLYYFIPNDEIIESRLIRGLLAYQKNKWFDVNTDGAISKNCERNKFYDLSFFESRLPKMFLNNEDVGGFEWGYQYFIDLSFNEKKRFLFLYELNYMNFYDIKLNNEFLKKDFSISKFKKLHDVFFSFSDTVSFDKSLLNHIFKVIVKNTDRSVGENITLWIKSLKKYKEGIHVFSHYIEFIAENFEKIHSIDLELSYLKKLGIMDCKEIVKNKLYIPKLFEKSIQEISTVQGVKTAGYLYQNCLRNDYSINYIREMKMANIRLFNISYKGEIALLKTNFYGLTVSELEGFGKQQVSNKLLIYVYGFIFMNILKYGLFWLGLYLVYKFLFR